MMKFQICFKSTGEMNLFYEYILKNKRSSLHSLNLNAKVLYSTANKDNKTLQECYNTLEVTPNSDQETIRKAYLALVKKYHPDNFDGDIKIFQKIDKAFRTITKHKSKERWQVEESSHCNVVEEEYDITHVAPQHRQYLSHDGVGTGTIFQREKQYAKIRALQAAENVMQHRIAKVTADDKALLDKAPFKHKIKTKYGFDRLVEDLIQESMSKGEFSNLSGTGKTLKDMQGTNPYVDFVTHKLNQVLIENGFAPEWIMLQKEILEELQQLKDKLSEERQYLGKHPLEVTEEHKWCEITAKENVFTSKLNNKIEKFNLLVPILNKQLVAINLAKIAENILIHGTYGSKRLKNNEHRNVNVRNDQGIFGIFHALFKK